jgi:cell division protein FtsB
MSLFYNKKWPTKIAAAIYNSHYIYILLLVLIVAQFILIFYLFFSIRSMNLSAVDQLNAKIDKISAQQNIMSEKINGLQSIMLLVQSQLYRK